MRRGEGREGEGEGEGGGVIGSGRRGRMVVGRWTERQLSCLVSMAISKRVDSPFKIIGRVGRLPRQRTVLPLATILAKGEPGNRR